MRQNKLLAPWSLHFDRDGTEDVAIILDADGDELAHSRHFWLPEADDETPGTLTAMRAMAAAPEMLAALKHALAYLKAYGGDTAAATIAVVSSAIASAIPGENRHRARSN
jgi:hypothetical protein